MTLPCHYKPQSTYVFAPLAIKGAAKRTARFPAAETAGLFPAVPAAPENQAGTVPARAGAVPAKAPGVGAAWPAARHASGAPWRGRRDRARSSKEASSGQAPGDGPGSSAFRPAQSSAHPTSAAVALQHLLPQASEVALIFPAQCTAPARPGVRALERSTHPTRA